MGEMADDLIDRMICDRYERFDDGADFYDWYLPRPAIPKRIADAADFDDIPEPPPPWEGLI